MWKKVKGSARPVLIILLVSLLLTGLVGYAVGQVMQGQSYTSAGAAKGIRPLRCIDDGSGRYCYMLVQTSSGVPTIVDDAAFTPGTSVVTPAGFLADDTNPDSVDENDTGAARMSLNRIQYVILRDGQGNERGAYVTASNELKVLDSNSATIAGDTTAIQTAIEIIDDAYKVTDDDDTGACHALSDSSAQHTLTAAGWHTISCTGNSCPILCGADPTATAAANGHFIKIPDGAAVRLKLAAAKCAYIAGNGVATGEVCFTFEGL